MDLFQCMYENQQFYTGLVEGLGYIYWTPQELYFAKVPHPDFPFKFQYQEIRMWEQHLYRNCEIKIKTKYNPHIISPEELAAYNKILYYDYYDGIPPLANDAIQRKDVSVGNNPEKKDNSNIFRDSLDEINDIGGKLDKPSLIAETLYPDNILTSKMGKVFTAASIVSIVVDIHDGEYVMAAEKAIDAAMGWYGVALEVGKAYNDSELNIIDSYFNSYVNYRKKEMRYERTGSSWDKRYMEHADEVHRGYSKRFNELMDSKRKRR